MSSHARPATDRRREIFRALLGREPVAGEATTTLRTWTGEAAVEHLLLVACGLDSAQAGEQEIYVQLRAAWQTARAAQVTGSLLDRIVSEALSMARHAHRLGYDDAPSLADLATERVLSGLDGPTALVALAGVSPVQVRSVVVASPATGSRPRRARKISRRRSVAGASAHANSTSTRLQVPR